MQTLVRILVHGCPTW